MSAKSPYSKALPQFSNTTVSSPLSDDARRPVAINNPEKKFDMVQSVSKEPSRIIDVRKIKKSITQSKAMGNVRRERDDLSRLRSVEAVIANNKQFREYSRIKGSQKNLPARLDRTPDRSIPTRTTQANTPSNSSNCCKSIDFSCKQDKQQPKIAMPKHLPHHHRVTLEKLSYQLRPIKNVTNSQFTTRRQKELDRFNLQSASNLHITTQMGRMASNRKYYQQQ